MELQPRDLAILETVGELGTADTEVLHQEHFPADKTGRACQERLRQLSQEGLLKRVRLIATDALSHGGSLPMLYFLTTTGAELVASETGVFPTRVTRSDPKPFTLRHRLATVRARLAIDAATRLAGIPLPEWIMEQDTRSDAKRSRQRSPSEYLILQNRYESGDGRKVTFRPDASCHLQAPAKSGYRSLLAYLEVDRSTEGHLQWQRKLLGIDAFLADSQGWLSHWPAVTNPVLVVLVLCRSQQRLANLIETTRPSPAAASFRFATYPLEPSQLLTSKIWLDCQGQRRRILR